MNKLTSIIISLLLVLTLSVLSGTGTVSAEPNEVTVIPTEEVKVTEEVTPSEEVKPTDCTPTPTTEVTATPTTEAPTATPTEKPGPTATPAPEKPLGGVPTMAKAGSFGQMVMNLSGIFGMLSVAAGSIVYATKRNS